MVSMDDFVKGRSGSPAVNDDQSNAANTTAHKHGSHRHRDANSLKVKQPTTTLPRQPKVQVSNLQDNQARNQYSVFVQNHAQTQYERNRLDDTDIGSLDDTTTLGESENDHFPHGLISDDTQEDSESGEGNDEESDRDEEMDFEQHDKQTPPGLVAPKSTTLDRLATVRAPLLEEAASYPPTSSGRPESIETEPDHYHEDQRPASRREGGYSANAFQHREVRVTERVHPITVMAPPASKPPRTPEDLYPTKKRPATANTGAPQPQGATTHLAKGHLQPQQGSNFVIRQPTVETNKVRPHQVNDKSARVQHEAAEYSRDMYAPPTKIPAAMASNIAPPSVFPEKKAHVGSGKSIAQTIQLTPKSQSQTLDAESDAGELGNRSQRPATYHSQSLAEDLDGHETQTQSVELDYEPDVLYGKDLTALRDEPFDVDPRVASRTDAVPPGTTLSDQVSAVFKLEAEQQREFFASLSLDQWEDAGDWFREQFSVMLVRMKQARREKRDLVHRFEDEIERRFDSVVKKRKLTENALAGMRSSGQQVLQNTPQKKQKNQT